VIKKSNKKSFQILVEFLNQELLAFFVGADKHCQKKQDQVVLFPFFKKWKEGYYELEFDYRRPATIKKQFLKFLEK